MKPLPMFRNHGGQEKPETLRRNIQIGNVLHLRDLFMECGRPLPPREKKIAPPIIPEIEPPPPVIKKERISPETFPPLPKYNPKSVDERIAEAEAFRGELPDCTIKEIMENIRESARDFGEKIDSESRPDKISLTHKITDIQNLVAQHFNMTRNEMLSGTQLARIARPRQIAMYLSKILTNCSYQDIGHRTGERDHTTVIHAVHKITGLMEKDKEFADKIAALKGMLLT